MDESTAIAILSMHGVRHVSGVIKVLVGTLDPELLDAVDYLCEEWDYSLEWVPA